MSAAHEAPRPAQRRRTRVIAATVVVLVVVGAALTGAVIASRPTGSSVTASSTATGFNAAALVEAPLESRTVAWRSSDGATTGVTLRLSFARPRSIDQLRWRGADRGTAPVAARVAFSDGSALLVTSTSRDADFSFIARRVTALELTVTGVRPGATSVALASLRVDDDAPTAVSDAVPIVRGGGSGTAGTTWSTPTEVAAVTLRSGGAEADRGGSLLFSDGSTVRVAGLSPAGPTTVAFTPRVATGVRYVPEQAQASRPEITVMPRGRATTAADRPSGGGGLEVTPGPPDTCSAARAVAGEHPRPVVLCPSTGTSVGSRASIAVSVAPRAVVIASAWQALPGSTSDGAITEVARAAADSTGVARLEFSTDRLLHGPLNVRLQDATGGSASYAQLVNDGGVVTSEAPPDFTSGMTLQFQDRFRSPVSVSDGGENSTYTATKPSVNGPTEFGDAIFAGSDWPGGHIGTLPTGGLRLRVTPTDRADPLGYDRKSIGALLSSTGLAGNGFSAQYGYFEARMLGAPGIGTWPAFWTQSVASMSGKGYPFGEADAVELYGRDTASACHGAVDWTPKATDPDVQCGAGDGIDDWALEWHTYGVRILPGATEIYVDGRLVRTLRALVDPADPFFFMVNLELGGGWPVDLSSTGGITDLYVSDIRVYT